jgi:hypothetical protein
MLRFGRTTIAMGALPGRDRFLSIDITPGGKPCSDHVTLYLVSLGLAVTTKNKGKIVKHETNQSGPSSVADPRIDITWQIACQSSHLSMNEF